MDNTVETMRIAYRQLLKEKRYEDIARVLADVSEQERYDLRIFLIQNSESETFQQYGRDNPDPT